MVGVLLGQSQRELVFDLIRREHVTHYCGAPIVQAALADEPTEWRAGINHTVHTMMAGSAPAPAIIVRIKAIGFELTHVYGLTEVFGPTTFCVEQEGWKH